MSLLSQTLEWLEQNNSGQDEFLQAAEEVCQHVVPIVNANEDYKAHNVLQRILSYQQIIEFQVIWENDNGEAEVNRGWRVQHSNALGPHKGGTRFHPKLNLSILKFLAFEQSLKNSLTQMSLGSGKGGADFNPRKRSKAEIRRFCNAYMRALSAHIGAYTDVPAGDINVGEKELGYMFGEYLRLSKSYKGVISGKPVASGGSNLRLQATGFGIIYFIEAMLSLNDDALKDKRLVISGAGNVALHAALKAVDKGAKVLSLSNSRGTLIATKGLSSSHIDYLLNQGKQEENALKALALQHNLKYEESTLPWSIEADIGIPCATQNEIDHDAAKQIIQNVSFALVEGANMPCTEKAASAIQNSHLRYAPGKAANAGGVVVSVFEMQQNAAMRYESEAELDKRLHQKMHTIHASCVEESQAQGNSDIDYVQAANIAGFRRLADAIVAQGY